MNKKTDMLKAAFDTNSYNSKLVSLNTEQAKEFVDLMVDESVLLKQVTMEKMNTPKKTLANIMAKGTFLHPGKHDANLLESQRQKATATPVELSTELLRGEFDVLDQELEDNIEGGSLEAKLVNIVAKKTANELEQIALYSRKRSGAQTSFGLYDGFIWRAIQDGNVVNASSLTSQEVSRELFVKMYKTMPTKWRNNAKWITGPDVIVDYNELFNNNFNRNEMINRILGKETIECPLWKVDRPATTTGGTTTSGVTSAGSTTITVADATGLTAGDQIVVGAGTVNEDQYTILSVSTNTLTLTEAVREQIPATTAVTEVTALGSDILLSDPKNLIVGIQTGGLSSERISFERERLAGIGFRYHFKIRVDFQIFVPEATVLGAGVKLK